MASRKRSTPPPARKLPPPPDTDDEDELDEWIEAVAESLGIDEDDVTAMYRAAVKPTPRKPTRKPARKPAPAIEAVTPVDSGAPQGFAQVESSYEPPTIAQIFDTDFRPSVTIADTDEDTIALDEDEDRELFGPRSEGFDQPELTVDEWTDGAADMIDADVADRRAHTHYSRDEVSEYLHELADGTGADISELYDMYYGYGDDHA